MIQMQTYNEMNFSKIFAVLKFDISDDFQEFFYST